MERERQHQKLEDSLIAELGWINRKITQLEAERNTVQRLLLRARRENAQNKDIARSTSVDRLLLEQTIVNHLTEKSWRPVSSSELRGVCKSMQPALKDSTFRSYIHRLKSRDIICSQKFGFWELTSAKKQKARD